MAIGAVLSGLVCNDLLDLLVRYKINRYTEFIYKELELIVKPKLFIVINLVEHYSISPNGPYYNNIKSSVRGIKHYTVLHLQYPLTNR